MRRIHLVLKRLELDKVWQQRHYPDSPKAIARIDELIAERQRDYDRLASVPNAEWLEK